MVRRPRGSPATSRPRQVTGQLGARNMPQLWMSRVGVADPSRGRNIDRPSCGHRAGLLRLVSVRKEVRHARPSQPGHQDQKEIDPPQRSPSRSVPAVTDVKRALAGKSDEMLEALKELKATEARKRLEPISTPMFHALADEVNAQSRRIFTISIDQDRLGDEAERGAETIDDLSARKPA